MRRLSRLERSIGALRPSPTQRASPYLCHKCQQLSTSTPLAAKKLPWSEKIRQRIWGSEEPPGLADPYGGPSALEKTIAERKARNAAKQGIPVEEAESREDASEKSSPVEAGQQIYSSVPDDPSYEPATNWDGLDEVGGYHPQQDMLWDQKHAYSNGFQTAEVMTDPGEIKTALHRALIEVYAWKESAMPLSKFRGGDTEVDLTHGIHIKPTIDFGVELEFRGSVSREELLKSLTSTKDFTAVATKGASQGSLQYETAVQNNPTETEEGVAADQSDVDTLEKANESMTYDDLVMTWGQQWTKVSIADPQIKFAVLKRMFQLSGIKFPDAAIGKSNTIKNVLEQVIKPPKPRKLIESLAQQPDLLNLPNVSVFAKRITPIDKEKAVGRWKLIEQELEARDLPVTGNGA